jgi:hypothetical protein
MLLRLVLDGARNVGSRAAVLSARQERTRQEQETDRGHTGRAEVLVSCLGSNNRFGVAGPET